MSVLDYIVKILNSCLDIWSGQKTWLGFKSNDNFLNH